MAGPLGVLATGPTAATTKVEDINGRPPEVLELEVWEHSACGARS
jgi:hypothetical protein